MASTDDDTGPDAPRGRPDGGDPRGPRARAVGLAARLYRLALVLFPARIRDAHGAEMEEMFADAWMRAWAAGPLPAAALVGRTVRDLTLNGLGARLEGGGGMETWGADFRQVVRGLYRRPGFTLVASVTIALGMGGTTAIYSIVDAAYLDPLPYPDDEEIVVPYQTRDASQGIGFAAFSAPFQEALAAEGPFESLAAIMPRAANVGGADQPERVSGVMVNAAFFDVAGVPPMVGRGFAADEDVPGGPDVAVIGHGLWTRRFAADPSVVGRSLQVDGVPTTVVGVMPEGFELLLPDVELWLPQRLDPTAFDPTSSVNNNRILVARVAPGTTGAEIQARLAASLEALRARFTDVVAENHALTLRPLRTHLYGDFRDNLFLLLGAVSLVLLIASANLASLLLVRAEERRTEFALRAALGASRGRIVRGLVTVSVVLSTLGAALGFAFAMGVLGAVRPFAPGGVPFPRMGDLDGSVLAMTFAVALATGVVFGLLPAHGAARRDLREALTEQGRGGTSAGRTRARGALVAMEVALTVILLVGSGLVLNSLWRLRTLDPGFEARDRTVAHIALPGTRYPDAGSLGLFHRELIESLLATPEVVGAGLSQFLPLTSASNWGFQVEGREELGFADYNLVTPGYLDALGMRIVSGRGITWDDTAEDAAPVVLVGESMARRLWPDTDPLGRRVNIDLGPPVWREVVGVVSDVRNRSLAQAPGDLLYLPPSDLPMTSARSMTLAVHHPGAPVPAAQLRSLVSEMDPSVPLTQLRTLDDVAAASERGRLFMLMLLGTFAGVAVALAGVGLYGVVAYALSLRVREIGLRMAMGAGRQRVLGLVARQSGKLVAVGLGIGLVGAAGLARFLGSLLYGVEAVDVPTYSGVVALALMVALVATWVPAARATSVDPASVLRE